MNTSENMNIEEVLNGYLDGELTARQQTEVQRLIANDEAVAKQLRQLAKCKMLVGSLPPGEAPAGMLSQIRGAVERRVLLGEDGGRTDRRAGARHLFYRKLVTAAAMLMLVGALAYVVYVIVAPGESVTLRVAADRGLVPTSTVGAPGVDEGESAVEGALDGIVVLRTDSLPTMERFASEIISRDLGGRCSIERVPQVSSVFTFRCSREMFSQLMVQFEPMWSMVGSARVVLDGRASEQGVDVEIAQPGEIAMIFDEPDYTRRLQVAKSLSLSNTGGDEGLESPLDVIPKPVLTTPEKPVTTGQDVKEDSIQITLILEQTK